VNVLTARKVESGPLKNSTTLSHCVECLVLHRKAEQAYLLANEVEYICGEQAAIHHGLSLLLRTFERSVIRQKLLFPQDTKGTYEYYANCGEGW
jgi:hypothetical protein